MKKLIICFILVIASVNTYAQNKNKKVSFEVKGNCAMCKARIEKASLKVKGVKYVNWDIPSKHLKLILDENKCTTLDIKKAIALVGHDTDSAKTDDKTYNDLPPCCKFRDPASIHLDHGTKP